MERPSKFHPAIFPTERSASLVTDPWEIGIPAECSAREMKEDYTTAESNDNEAACIRDTRLRFIFELFGYHCAVNAAVLQTIIISLSNQPRRIF